MKAGGGACGAQGQSFPSGHAHSCGKLQWDLAVSPT